MNYNEYCNAFKCDDLDKKNKANLIFSARNFLLDLVSFDSLSGEPIACGFVDFIDRASRNEFANAQQDYMSYIINDFQNSFYYISKKLNDKIVRENKIMPISKVKEINSASVNWLSKKPGSTVKQKLSNSNNKIMAVNRYSSLDTGENRLFKTLVSSLEEVLSLKIENINTNEEQFYTDLLQILRDDTLLEISRFENTAPNNTLLSHRQYKVAWQTWIKLNNLDEIINRDYINLDLRLTAMFFVKLNSYLSTSVNFYQDLVLCDFDDFGFNFNNKKLNFILDNKNNKFKLSIKEQNAKWNVNEKGAFCFVKRSGRSIVLFKSNFANIDDFSEDCNSISFELIPNHKKVGQFIAKNITLDDGFYENTCSFGSVELSHNKIIFTLDEEETVIEFNNNQIFINNEKSFDLDYKEFDLICLKIAKLLLKNKYKSTQPLEQHETINSNMCVIDLCGYKISYSADNADKDALKNNIFNFKLNVLNDGTYFIPMGNSKVVRKNENCELISFQNIFKNNSFENIDSLVKNIKNEINTKTLVYVIPDSLDEFQSNAITKKININFAKSIPFPKSMGLIFDWQSSNKFNVTDYVLIVNFFNNNLTFTLVKSKFNKELEEKIPQTQGITWERFPTDKVHFTLLQNNAINILIQRGCTNEEADFIVNSIGVENLYQLKETIYFDFKSHWFCVDKAIVFTMQQNFTEKNFVDEIDDKIQNYLSKSQVDKNSSVKIILGTNLLSSNLKNVKVNLCYVQGYNILNNYQSQVNFPLWENHIPSLSIKQIYGKFSLMSNTKVVPIFGNKVNITIDNDFTLSKNINVYKFPLIIGEDAQEPQYEATLKSLAFPLKDDVVCKLLMTYEYGAIEPYTLIFKPKEKLNAPFNQLKVEWSKITSYPCEDLPYPKFPCENSWENFKKYPNNYDPSKTTNLLDRIVSVMDSIPKTDNCIDYIEVDLKNAKWREDNKNTKWREDSKNTKRIEDNKTYSCELYVKSINKSLVIVGKPVKYTKASKCFVKISEYKDNRTKKVDNSKRFARHTVLDLDNIYNDFVVDELLRKSLFHFHTVFFNNRNIEDADVPKEFTLDIKNNLPNIINAFMQSKGSNKIYYYSLLVLISGAYPEEQVKASLEHIGTTNIIEKKIMGFSLGNLEHEKQKELFNEIYLKHSKEDVIFILSKALWWNENLIFKIELNILEELFYESIKCLKRDMKYRNLKSSKITPLLEFMLAIFRLRELENAELNLFLSRNNPKISNLYIVLENLSQKIINSKNVELKTFVKIDVTKSENNEEIPTILYALILYVTGNNSANEIKISGIDDG